MVRYNTAAIGLCLFCVTLLANGIQAESVHRIVEEPEWIGNPFTRWYPSVESIYARNIWDLQVYNNRLYLGAGNSSNVGTAPNAGPVPLLFWNPDTRRFQQEFMVNDEQIDRYVVLDDQLVIPGHDARQNWTYGNVYRLQPGAYWRKFRTIPGALHVYDITRSRNALFAGFGTVTPVPGGDDPYSPESAVAVSQDEGKTWHVMKAGGMRIYAFLHVDGLLYATDLFLTRERLQQDDIPIQTDRYAPVYQVTAEPRLIRRPDLDAAAISPGLELKDKQAAKVVKPLTFRGRAVYIGGYVHNDHQFWPFGLYSASSLKIGERDVRRLSLPRGMRPWDLLLRDTSLYVLLNGKTRTGWQVRVLVTSDLTIWTEALRFNAPAFARSFELLQGDFYFGLGSEVRNPRDWTPDELHPATGDILRVEKNSLTSGESWRRDGYHAHIRREKGGTP
ncbi:MAG: hypothetical protein GY801_34105 [bacterium]|nr:hypothetical protein [bacterium]